MQYYVHLEAAIRIKVQHFSWDTKASYIENKYDYVGLV